MWIALFGLFLLYMKWFNQPLAQWISNFIIKSEKITQIDLIDEELENNEMIQEDDDKMTKEDDVSVDVSDDILSHRNKLFEQLDRIENVLWSSEIKTEKTEDIFDEFKLWYETNKK